MTTLVLGQTGISVAPYLEPPDGIELDEQQRACVARIRETPSASFFVTGKAGCGKTATMRVLAGANVRAMTVDLFLQHKPGRDHGKQLQEQRALAPNTLRKAPRVILEEIGQWSAANLAMLDKEMQRVCRSSAPFGGTQIVANGDFAQLAPVGNDPVNTHELWERLDLETITLTRQHRQTEDAEDYVLFLEQLRASISTRSPLPPFAAAMLDYFFLRPPRGEFLGVTLTKQVCQERNWLTVHQSVGPRFVVADGRLFPKMLPGSSAVPLVPGCRVQVTTNVWENGRPVVLNGQFGHFLGFDGPIEDVPETILTINRVGQMYQILNPRSKCVARVVLDCDGVERKIGFIETKKPKVGDDGETRWKKEKIFPFECAYWTRLHRLQGQSVEGRMHIDFQSAISFEPATIYVGLSRGKRIPDVSVSNIDSYTFERIVKHGE